LDEIRLSRPRSNTSDQIENAQRFESEKNMGWATCKAHPEALPLENTLLELRFPDFSVSSASRAASSISLLAQERGNLEIVHAAVR
jgi:hypothetical protein